MIVYSIVSSYILVQNYIAETGEDYSFTLGKSLLIGIFGVVIVLIFLIQKKKYWVHALSLLILLTITPLVTVSNFSLYVGAGILSFDIVALSLLGLHLFLNDEARAPIKRILQESPKEKDERLNKEREDFDRAVQRFKRKFESFSKAELNEIIEKNQYVPEAIEAAKELVSEKE